MTQQPDRPDRGLSTSYAGEGDSRPGRALSPDRLQEERRWLAARWYADATVETLLAARILEQNDL